MPLKVVAEISFGAGPSIIQRINQERRIMVGADLAPGVVDGETIDQPAADHAEPPEGVERARSGQQREEAKLVSEFMTALISGTFLVFAVLVLLYKRLMAPFVNMGSLLLAPLGGAIALHIAGHAVSMPVLIGILMLFGIVAKNSILLLDFTIEEMAKGVPKNEAIIDAGHKRAQPIVMTTMAMVAGMVPTALSLEGDASWRAPMAVVVIGGLLLSTAAHPGARAGVVQPRRQLREVAGAEGPPRSSPTGGRRTTARRPRRSRRSRAIIGGGLNRLRPDPPPVIQPA